MGPKEAREKAMQHSEATGRSCIAYYDSSEDTYKFCREEEVWKYKDDMWECDIPVEDIIFTTEEK